LTPGLARRSRHRLDDAPQVRERQALLEDEAGRQVERPGAGHGDVVDRAVHGEATDVAAGEEQRRDHVRVGGDHQPPGWHLDLCLVVEAPECLVVELRDEQLLDELRRGAPAAAVGHLDLAVAEVQGAREAAPPHVTAAPAATRRDVSRKRPYV
jgi:hypothetical protein